MVTFKGKEVKGFSFDDAYDKLAERRRTIHDITCPLNEWEPKVSETNKLVLQHKDYGEFTPTEHALSQMAIVGGNQGGGFLKSLGRDVESTNKKKDNGYKRDRLDAELQKHILENTLFRKDRVNQEKPRFFRTWKDGTLRALLSTQYAVINNSWYLEVLQNLIPDGVFLRWRGNADNFNADLLVPDSLMESDDSGYGGYIHVVNSEIGLRRISGIAGTYRMICTNGMIGIVDSSSFVGKIHKGNVDLEALRISIEKGVKEQLRLIDNNIQQVLGIKAYGVGDVPMPRVFAQIAKDYRIGRPHMMGILDSYATEMETVGKSVKSAFGVVQALTRYAQTRNDDEAEEFEMIGGKIASMGESRWNNRVEIAKKLDKDDMVNVYGEPLATALSA